jgi:hypothetical protein
MKHRSGILTVLILVLLLAALPVGSSHGDTSSATYLVTASAGAQLESPSGKMTLSIPPGALESDTEISISEEEAEGGTSVGLIYDIQPDGLVLLKPALLTVHYDADEMPEAMSMEDVAITQVIVPDANESGMEIPAGWEYLDTWLNPTSGTASVQIEHFSRYGASTPRIRYRLFTS